MTSSSEAASRPIVEFDHHSAKFAAHFAEVSRDLRERCPVAFTGANGGYWVASGYDAVFTAAGDSETFTVWKDVPLGSGPRRGPLIPDRNPVRQGFSEMGGPEHDALRQPLEQFFSPAAIEAFKPEILSIATWVVDQSIERGSADLATEFTVPPSTPQ